MEILETIAGQYDLNIVGGERIPHDLWGGGTFIAESAAEALSLILIQFDLTFQWRNQAADIEIVAIPDSVTVVRNHNPRPHSAQQATELIGGVLPRLPLRVEEGKLVVQGTVEEQEAIERLLHPPAAKIAIHPRDANDDPLKNERITLQVMGVPVLALIKDLEKRYNMEFAYDAEVLAAAKIDLGQKVEINVAKTTIDGYLAAFISRIGAEFERNGLRVTIHPASRKRISPPSLPRSFWIFSAFLKDHERHGNELKPIQAKQDYFHAIDCRREFQYRPSRSSLFRVFRVLRG